EEDGRGLARREPPFPRREGAGQRGATEGGGGERGDELAREVEPQPAPHAEPPAAEVAEPEPAEEEAEGDEARGHGQPARPERAAEPFEQPRLPRQPQDDAERRRAEGG